MPLEQFADGSRQFVRLPLVLVVRSARQEVGHSLPAVLVLHVPIVVHRAIRVFRRRKR